MRILVKAVAMDGLKPFHVLLIAAEIKPVPDEAPQKTLEKAIRNAFVAWSKTNEECAEKIKRGETNWSDALLIPRNLLQKHGILSFEVIDLEKLVEAQTEAVVEYDDQLCEKDQ